MGRKHTHTQTNRDPNHDNPRESETLRREEDVFGYELQRLVYSVWSAASISKLE